MAAATGLYEVVKQPYLQNRIGQVERFAQRLQSSGVDVLLPPGGHAVYLDMDAFFKYCDRSPGDFASVGFVLELLEKYGIRTAEAGPFGWEWDKKSPAEQAKIPNLVRLAVPRYVLSEEHITYTVAAIVDLHNKRHEIPNVVISRGKDMRLRHFSCGLKPVPVQKAITASSSEIEEYTATYLSEARRHISHLSHAVSQTTLEKNQLAEALAFSTGTWGSLPITAPSSSQDSWRPEVSNDHSPYEYSVAIDQRTGAAELRFLIEAQPTQNRLSALRDAGMALARQIGTKYHDTVSLDRFELIKDLFIPSTSSPSTNSNHDEIHGSFDKASFFSAWFSCALSAKSGPEWKIYLNPRARGAASASSVTREAFARLGLAESWDLLADMMARTDDAVVYFSLDLGRSSENRVKVYISHPRTTAGQIAGKISSLCPDTSAYEVERFVRAMAGGDGGEDTAGPFEGKSLLTCFAFTSKAPLKPVGTVHFPIIAYAEDDRIARQRVESYMTQAGVSDKFRGKYRDVISAVQRRPLNEGRGIHAWVSLKSKAGGKRVNTFYISPELYGPVDEAEIDTGPRKRSKRASMDSGVCVETSEGEI